MALWNLWCIITNARSYYVSAKMIYPLRGNFVYPFAIGWIKQYSNFEDLVSSETMTKVFFFCRKRDLDHKLFARLDLSLPKTFIFQHIFPFFFSFREEESLPIALIFALFSWLKKGKRTVWTRNILAKSGIILAKNAEEMQKGKG